MKMKRTEKELDELLAKLAAEDAKKPARMKAMYGKKLTYCFEPDEIGWLYKTIMSEEAFDNATKEYLKRKCSGESFEAVVTRRIERFRGKNGSRLFVLHARDKTARTFGFDRVLPKITHPLTNSIRHTPDLLVIDESQPTRLIYIECKSVSVDRDSYDACMKLQTQDATVYYAFDLGTEIMLVEITDLRFRNERDEKNCEYDEDGWFITKFNPGDGSNSWRKELDVKAVQLYRKLLADGRLKLIDKRDRDVL